jgi:hypothetical protein
MVTSEEFIEKMNALDPDVAVLEPVGSNEEAVIQQQTDEKIFLRRVWSHHC